MINTKLIAAAAVTFAFVSPASAVTITSITGVWESANVSGGSASGIGTDAILWGRAPSGGPQSGYSFDAEQTPVSTNVDEVFQLGAFTHSNNPIYTNGPLLNDADLAVSFTIAGSDETFKSVFKFDHSETPNSAQICADGQTKSAFVNANGCADSVTAVLNENASQGFFVDGLEYVLDISGFLFNDTLLDTFWTRESEDNTAVLQASYRLISDDTPPQDVPPFGGESPSEVPLPATGLLLLGALAGLAMKRRSA